MDSSNPEKGFEVETVVLDKARVRDIINKNLHTPFEWGKWDCSIFVVECFLPSFNDQLIGAYDSEEGALAKIQELGGFDQIIPECGGVEVEGGVNFAQNYCIAKMANHETLGIVEGRYIITITPDYGMTRLPRRMAEKAWSFE